MTALRTSRPAAGAAILGTGQYRPQRVVDNEEICRHIDSSDQWIRERTGIVTRRFAGPDENVVTMGVAAGRRALERAGVDPARLDMVIAATITHMYQTPAAAPQIAHALGASAASAFDLGAACSGFCHGVGVADGLIRSGAARYVLLVGTEKMTDIVDIADRSISFIFADGAGAMLIGPSDEPRIGPTVWGADGGEAGLITQERAWSAPRPDDDTLTYPYLRMEGRPVFRWSVFEMPAVARQATEAAGLELGDLAAMIPHQANNRIIEAMVKQLKLPEHVVVSHDIVTTGNTSGASVPLATDTLLAEHPELAGRPALLIGFGAGLAYAAQVVTLPGTPPR